MKRCRVVRLIFVLATVLLSVVIVELVSHAVWRNLPGRLANGKRFVEVYAGLEESLDAQVESHPYMLYQLTSDFYAMGQLQHNRLRYRNPPFEVEDRGVSCRILALGGSTTYMFPYISDPAKTWVGQLEANLKRRVDHRVQVVNAGLSYGTTAELLAAYVFRHQYIDPDILIIHTGGNDIAPLFFDDYDPEYTHFRSAGSGMKPRPFERTLLRYSRFMRVCYAVWLRDYEPVYVMQPKLFGELDRREVLERVKRNPSPGFERNLDTLIRLAKSNGTQVVLFGFLQARKENLARTRADFVGLEEAWIAGLEKHYEIMRKLAEKHDVPLIEPDQDLFDDDWFQDQCHLNEEGEARKAEILANFFVNRRSQYFPATRPGVLRRGG